MIFKCIPRGGDDYESKWIGGKDEKPGEEWLAQGPPATKGWTAHSSSGPGSLEADP